MRHKKQKRVLFDADGVLLDFTDHLLGRLGLSETIADVTQWDIFSLLTQWHGPDMKKRALELCGDPAFWLEQPMMVGADKAVAVARSLDCVIKCVTAPWEPCREWEYARRVCLLRHFGIGAKDIISAGDKVDVRGDLFIDDKIEHVRTWADANPNGLAVLYTAPYNKDDLWPVRASWADQGLSHLRGLIQAV